MKKFDILKTLQLVIFVILTAVGVYTIFTDKELYQIVGTDPHVSVLCILLWLALGLSFVFIFVDFTTYSSIKKELRELDFAVHSDQVSGIANRYSCDAVIERYLDRPLPRDVGCIMFDLTNIKEINALYGHLQGNTLIRDFSAILHSASTDLCFVGRNGGNKFLAIFEKCTNKNIELFLDRIEESVNRHNMIDGSYTIVYDYGVAFREPDVDKITELIALSNKRIYEKNK